MNALALVVAFSVDFVATAVVVLACVALRCGWIDGQVTVKAVPPWKRSGPKSAPKGEAAGGDPS